MEKSDHAIERMKDLPFGTAFLFHATIGACRSRPEPELERVHRIAVDSAADGERLAQAILDSYREATADTRSPAAAAAVG